MSQVIVLIVKQECLRGNLVHKFWLRPNFQSTLTALFLIAVLCILYISGAYDKQLIYTKQNSKVVTILSKVYSYMRFSTPEQSKGHSLQRQTDYATQYALDNGLVLDESLTMRDEGLSAYHQKHISKGALGTFYRGIEEGMVEPGSILIVENLDRLSRAKPLDALPHFLNIIKAGITVVIAKDGKTYSQETIDKSPFILLESIIDMVRANQESEYKSERVKAALVGRINHWIEHGHGRVLTIGQDPYWLKVKEDKKGFDVIPEYAAIVQDILYRYQQGWGLTKIIEYLTSHYKPFNGNKWHMSFLYKLIRTRTLIGERYFEIDNKRYVIENYYPALLSDTDFIIFQNEVKNRATTQSQQKIPSIVTGNRICFCGHCGNAIVTQNRKQRTYKNKVYERTPGLNRIYCSSKIHGPKCTVYTDSPDGITTVQSGPIERALLQYCADQMELSAILNDDTDKSLAIKAQIAELQRQASEAETVVNNGNDAMTRLLMQGDDVSAINNLVKQHQTKLDDLQTKISKLKDDLRFQKVHKSADLIAQWDQVKSDVMNMDEETRLLVRQIVKKTFKRMDIYFHSFGKSDIGKILNLPIDDQSIVMVLTFINDKTRLLVIDRKTGDWITHRNIQISESSVLSSLADGQAHPR